MRMRTYHATTSHVTNYALWLWWWLWLCGEQADSTEGKCVE